MIFGLSKWQILAFLDYWVSIAELIQFYSALCNKIQRRDILNILNVKFQSQTKNQDINSCEFCGSITVERYTQEPVMTCLILGKSNNNNSFEIDSLFEIFFNKNRSKLTVVYVSKNESLSELLLPQNSWNRFESLLEHCGGSTANSNSTMSNNQNKKMYWLRNNGHFSVKPIMNSEGDNAFIVQIRSYEALFSCELTEEEGRGVEKEILLAFGKEKGNNWVGTKIVHLAEDTKDKDLDRFYRQNEFNSHYTYVGEMCDDLEHGEGTRISARGDRYTGSWRDGRMDGRGVMEDHVNDTHYTGEWYLHYREGQAPCCLIYLPVTKTRNV
jgi:hypothetical protein